MCFCVKSNLLVIVYFYLGFDLQEVEVYETGRSSTIENDIKQAVLKQVLKLSITFYCIYYHIFMFNKSF